jgi:hypothetical protein
MRYGLHNNIFAFIITVSDGIFTNNALQKLKYLTKITRKMEN